MSRFIGPSVFILGLVCGFAASAAPAPAKPLYAWRTEHDADKTTHEFRHCLVKNMYDNGTIFMVARNGDGARRLAIHFPVDKLTVNAVSDVTLQVDGGDIFPTEAMAVTKRILSIPVPDALPEQMRKGKTLYLRGPLDDMQYALDGVRGALHALNDCVATHKPDSAPDAPDMPVMAEKTDDAAIERMKMADAGGRLVPVEKPVAATVTPTSPAIPAPVANAPAPTLLAAVAYTDTDDTAQESSPAAAPSSVKTPVTAPVAMPVAIPPVPVAAPTPPPAAPLLPSITAQYAAINMAPTKTRATLDAPVDTAWKAGAHVTVGFKRLDGISNADLNAAATRYLRDMKAQCDGPFIAEASTPRINAARKTGWLVAEAACAPRNGNDSVIALAFVNAPEGLNIHVFHAAAENGAAAITARDALVAHITQ